MSDLLAAEALIADRVRDTMPELTTVGSPATLAAATDITPLLPAVFVAPESGGITDTAMDGRLVLLTQTWLVSLLVPNRVDTGESPTATAGPLLGTLISVLAGWPPGDATLGLQFAGYGQPSYEAGYAEIPLRFTLQANVELYEA